MALQTFEADGLSLGSRTVPNFGKSSLFGPHITHSVAYFCPECGEVWGRLRHEGGRWQMIHRNCASHGDGRLASFWREGAPTQIAADWPRDALLRELRIELNSAQ